MFLKLCTCKYIENRKVGRLDLPGAASSPAFARGERSAVGPANAVLARSTVGIGDTATSIGPERVEVAIASSLLARGDRSLFQLTGKRKGSYGSTSSHKEAWERDHNEGSDIVDNWRRRMNWDMLFYGRESLQEKSFYIHRRMWGVFPNSFISWMSWFNLASEPFIPYFSSHNCTNHPRTMIPFLPSLSGSPSPQLNPCIIQPA